MNWVKLMSGVLAYLAVGLVYVAFFSYPVNPAYVDNKEYHLEKEQTYSTLPYVVYRIYIRESAAPGILLVATVRTPFLPHSTYSKILRAMEGIIENETKKRYNADIDLVYREEVQATISNHTVVMAYYDVHLKYLNFEHFFRPDTVKLYFGAFFCNQEYESVIVAYVAPPYLNENFEDVMNGIRC